jgi:hypothetical protein
MLKIKLLLLAIVATMVMGISSPAPARAFDFFPNNVCHAADTTTKDTNGSPVCQQATSQKQSNNNPVISTIQTASSIMAFLAGVLAVIMIIVSGFTFVTSGGSSEATASARKRIVNSIIGIVIVGLAWLIIRVITDRIIQ